MIERPRFMENKEWYREVWRGGSVRYKPTNKCPEDMKESIEEYNEFLEYGNMEVEYPAGDFYFMHDKDWYTKEWVGGRKYGYYEYELTEKAPKEALESFIDFIAKATHVKYNRHIKSVII